MSMASGAASRDIGAALEHLPGLIQSETQPSRRVSGRSCFTKNAMLGKTALVAFGFYWSKNCGLSISDC